MGTENQFFIGIISGVLASIIAIVVWESISVAKDNRKFHRLIGHYKGFKFQNDKANPLIRGEEQSEAEITYAGFGIQKIFALFDRNVLKINVTHGTDKKAMWTGLITMQNRSLGTIDWRYKYGVEGESFGAKWLIVSQQDKVISFYTVEFVRPESFGSEAFTKHKGKTK